MLFEADQSLMERAMVDCFCDSGEKSGIILRAFAEGLGTNVLFDMASRFSIWIRHSPLKFSSF